MTTTKQWAMEGGAVRPWSRVPGRLYASAPYYDTRAAVDEAADFLNRKQPDLPPVRILVRDNTTPGTPSRLADQHQEVTCTLDGWLPDPGSYVWQQMYSPQHPTHDSTIVERIQKGRTYGPRRLMRVLRIVPNDPHHGGRDRYYLIAADHKYTEATIARLMQNLGALGDWPDAMSATESDWAVLWPADAQAEMGVLF